MTKLIKIIFPVYVLPVFLVFQACSGIQVSQDYDQSYDFSNLKTFSWKPNKNNEYGLSDNALVDKRIRASMVNGFLEKNIHLLSQVSPTFISAITLLLNKKSQPAMLTVGYWLAGMVEVTTVVLVLVQVRKCIPMTKVRC